MKLTRNRKRQDLVLNIAPLIDVVFLLLIFFMVATSFDEKGSFNLELPKSTQKEEIKENREIQLIIDKDKKIFIKIDKTLNSINIDDLHAKLLEIISTSNNKNVIISADKDLSYGYIVEIMDLVKEAGADQINIDTSIKR